MTWLAALVAMDAAVVGILDDLEFVALGDRTDVNGSLVPFPLESLIKVFKQKVLSKRLRPGGFHVSDMVEE